MCKSVRKNALFPFDALLTCSFQTIHSLDILLEFGTILLTTRAVGRLTIVS